MQRMIALLIGAAAGAGAWIGLRPAVGWTPEAPALGTELTGTPSAPSQPTVILLFRPQDCPARLAGIDQLNRIYREGRVRVVGLLLVDTLEYRDWTAVVRANRIDFPVRPVPGKALRAVRGLGYASTPVYLALDTAQRVAIASESGEELPALVPLRFRAARPGQ